MTKPALGRGLSALLGGGATKPVPNLTTAPAAAPAPAPAAPKGDVQRVPLSRIHPCPFQPRKDFSAQAIQELADSIKEKGIMQPLIVRPKDDGFELIAGERRWRAAQIAGQVDAPVLVRDVDDRGVLELALVENLQRENLNPIEEAQGFAQLIEQFQLTQEDAAAKVGKGRVAVANALRLLKLAPEVQAFVRDGHLSVGHAKVILALNTHAEHKLAAEKIIKNGLNVRQTEDFVAQLQHQPDAAPAHKAGSRQSVLRDTHVVDLENRLQERLGTKVSVRYRKGKGAVEIRFFSDDDLDRVLQAIGVKMD
ncbi:MAG: ParB/RepB/Spo0J family partition protein [Verrucomicrobiota bacterium]